MLLLVAALFWTAPLLADAGPVNDPAAVKEVDFAGLTEAQKKIALKLLNEKGCNCGCKMTIASCRLRDSSCRRSLIFARTVVDALREGKKESEATQLLDQKSATFVEAKLPDDTGTVYNIDTSHDPVRGPKDSPITIIEFSDFQCPFCAGMQEALDKVLKAFPREVHLVYKQFPLNIHPYARQAALASLAAHSQGKFWEMHDRLFRNFSTISEDNIRKWAKEVGLNMAEFEKAVQSGQHEAMVQKDVADGAAAKVVGTPTVYINGKRITDKSFEGFKKMIQEELAAQRGSPSPDRKAAPATTSKSSR